MTSSDSEFLLPLMAFFAAISRFLASSRAFAEAFCLLLAAFDFCLLSAITESCLINIISSVIIGHSLQKQQPVLTDPSTDFCVRGVVGFLMISCGKEELFIVGFRIGYYSVHHHDIIVTPYYRKIKQIIM